MKVVPRNDVPDDANVINSHTLYKIKINDDRSPNLKACIPLHGNEDATKSLLSADCTICPADGLRIVDTIAPLKKWIVQKEDVESAFLHTGQAKCAVYE